MSYLEKIQQIDSLQAAIQAHGPIPQELLNKINYKLRLEWNYTSNSMEGNSLTKRETRTVMVNNIEVKGKPIKDVMEIKNHDTVVKTIMKVGKGELNISESRIKDIHKGIMYEEDPEKLKYVGQWKNIDNFMTNFDGERYDFVSHTEVSERMHQLVNWLNAEKEKIERGKKDAIHPVMLSLKFHIDYLTIHPFYDGNGRTARILSNLILISYGFPPFYIKEVEKESYYRYLTDIQSNGGSPDLFYEFMADLILRSMQIILDMLEGKEIEEGDDFIKELQLLKAKAKSKGKPKSPQIIYDVFKTINDDWWVELGITLKYFDDLFNETQNNYGVNGSGTKYETKLVSAIKIPFHHEVSNAPKKIKIFGYDIYETDIREIEWEHKMFSLNGIEKPIDLAITLDAKFGLLNYNVSINISTGQWESPKSIYTLVKFYDEAFSIEEFADMNSSLKRYLIDEIKACMDEDGQ